MAAAGRSARPRWRRASLITAGRSTNSSLIRCRLPCGPSGADDQTGYSRPRPHDHGSLGCYPLDPPWSFSSPGAAFFGAGGGAGATWLGAGAVAGTGAAPLEPEPDAATGTAVAVGGGAGVSVGTAVL